MFKRTPNTKTVNSAHTVFRILGGRCHAMAFMGSFLHYSEPKPVQEKKKRKFTYAEGLRGAFAKLRWEKRNKKSQ